MPNYFIRVDGQFMTREDLLERLEDQEWPQEFTIEGIVSANHPESTSHTFFRVQGGYSHSTHQVLFHPGLGAAGAVQPVNFEHVRQSAMQIMDGFGPNAVAILNPPVAQAPVNVAADWDDLPGPEPVNPGPGFFDPELGHLPPLMAQQALGDPNFQPGALPMPAPYVPNVHPQPQNEYVPAQLPAFLPVMPIVQPAAAAQPNAAAQPAANWGPAAPDAPAAPAAAQQLNQNNMNVNNNNNYMNILGGRRRFLRRKSLRRRTQRRGTQRRRSLRRRTQRRRM